MSHNHKFDLLAPDLADKCRIGIQGSKGLDQVPYQVCASLAWLVQGGFMYGPNSTR